MHERAHLLAVVYRVIRNWMRKFGNRNFSRYWTTTWNFFSRTRCRRRRFAVNEIDFIDLIAFEDTEQIRQLFCGKLKSQTSRDTFESMYLYPHTDWFQMIFTPYCSYFTIAKHENSYNHACASSVGWVNIQQHSRVCMSYTLPRGIVCVCFCECVCLIERRDRTTDSLWSIQFYRSFHFDCVYARHSCRFAMTSPLCECVWMYHDVHHNDE